MKATMDYKDIQAQNKIKVLKIVEEYTDNVDYVEYITIEDEGITIGYLDFDYEPDILYVTNKEDIQKLKNLLD